MASTIRVRMTYKDGTTEFWTIRRVPRAVNCNCPTIAQSRVISGWEFTSADGVTRFSEGTWRDLVPMFHLVAENYGMTCNLS